ncbi:hypothetical protein BDB01DRAFT_398218 [Pilobolus umbonatus]|nr:hypothetical protein BDB01DRAFT_398218 [Pilobolus umbonatus]
MDTNLTVNIKMEEELKEDTVQTDMQKGESADVKMETDNTEHQSNEDTKKMSNKDNDVHMSDLTLEDNSPSTTKQSVETPLLSAPASWQIPVGALQARTAEPPVNKATIRKERLESRIKDNKYDIEAWTSLINDAQQTGDLDVIREIYERFLKVFPTS